MARAIAPRTADCIDEAAIPSVPGRPEDSLGAKLLMPLVKMKLITIVAEEILKDRLVKKVQELGATGASFHRTQGVGSRSTRHNDMFGENLQMKIVCTAEVATAIITYIEENYFENYAIVAWIGDVEVVRGSHYVKGAT
jgi:nitrogen regulatory protein P-II 2